MSRKKYNTHLTINARSFIPYYSRTFFNRSLIHSDFTKISGRYSDCPLDSHNFGFSDSQKVIHLKIWPEYFTPVATGHKTFVCRVFDRSFKVGSILMLWEFIPSVSHYTSQCIAVQVSYVLTDQFFGITPGFCVLGLQPVVTESQAMVLNIYRRFMRFVPDMPGRYKLFLPSHTPILRHVYPV